MKKIIWSSLVAVLSVLMICSCKDEDESVLSTDCYISSFSLGNVKRLVTVKDSNGEDSTYYASYSAAYYPMTVNQLEGTVVNSDSLPVKSELKAVLASISSTGTVVYRKSEEENNWTSYSSSDSIDFTTPLIFRVYSTDYTVWRDYTVKVNMHQQDGDVFSWKKMAEPGLWTTAEELKACIWQDKIWMFSASDGNVRLFTSALSDGSNWTEEIASGCESADVETLASFNGRLYMSCTDGRLLSSEDAKLWQEVQAERSIRLLTADETNLYGVSDCVIWRSADGLQWTEEALDEEPSLLPEQDWAAVAYTQGNGVERVTLVGNRNLDNYPTDCAARVWSRNNSFGVESGRWIYFNIAPDNPYVCPSLNSLNLIHYNDVLMVLGGKSLDGTSHEALDGLYISKDNGLTWKADGECLLPEDLKGADGALTAVADSEHYLWLVVGDEVWRGRLNKLGFETE